MIIDTHAHLDFPQFGNKRGQSLNLEKIGEVVKRAQDAGVGKIINIGCNLKASQDSITISETFENVFGTVGVHPCDVNELTDENIKKLYDYAKSSEKVVAIGEVGLDYFHKDVAIDKQKEFFRKQIDLAKEVSKPLIIHCRDAYEDTMEVLDADKPENLVFHCYSGDLEFAQGLWNRGYLTSFTGIVTYPKVWELLEVVKECPMDMFMVETDCPFLAPQAYRGQTNEPAFVTEVVRKIAEVKGMSYKEIERISTENAERFFGI